ncbi:hypothetical protein [Bacillus sp. 03113]|uniref:hypothetical protein n=1 Tax=Bacillus sp. 03113 TaxID=2578211 RepID=UPI001141C5CA|nr:hypothetical protein [Bacillus sp. 03113]
MDIILSNLPGIIIAIGIISTIVKKVKDAQDKESTLKPLNPNARKAATSPKMEIKQIIEDSLKELKPAAAKKTESRIEEKINEKKLKAKEVMQGLNEQQAQIKKNTNQIKAKNQAASMHATKPQPSFAEGKNIVDAIIWSEIIGPPKSKKMHDRRHGNRFIR